MNLILGTAQFGGNYGLFDPGFLNSKREISKVLDFAYNSGVKAVDTANTYQEGRTIEILGRLALSRFGVGNKITATAEGSVNSYLDNLRATLRTLKKDSYKSVLVHNYDSIDSDQKAIVFEALFELKERGLTSKVGVSTYFGESLVNDPHISMFDVVQLPYNPLDQRVLDKAVRDIFEEYGIELQVRSVFLQGVLLNSSLAQAYFASKGSLVLREWKKLLMSLGCSPLDLCLAYVRRSSDVFKEVVVGVNNVKHLEEIIDAWNSDNVRSLSEQFLPQFDVPNDLIIPWKWSL